MKEFDLLVIGEINADLILRGQDVKPAFGQAEKLVEAAELTIGSSSVIAACGAARLGLRTAFIGVVGDDLFGHFMLDAMTDRGIDTTFIIVAPQLATGLSVILVQPNGDRAILTFTGSISALEPAQVKTSVISRARHLHVGSYFLLDRLRPALSTLFGEARQMGLTTSLDTNWDPDELWGVGDLLANCDLFLPNETEARQIAGRTDLPGALSQLATKVPILVVKMGAVGARAIQGDVDIQIPAYPMQVVDTVGAGDSFDAGFLYGFLHAWPLERSLKLALACGSLSTRAAGGTATQPTLEEAEEMMRMRTAK